MKHPLLLWYPPNVQSKDPSQIMLGNERLSKSLRNNNCTNALQTSHFLKNGLKMGI